MSLYTNISFHTQGDLKEAIFSLKMRIRWSNSYTLLCLLLWLWLFSCTAENFLRVRGFSLKDSIDTFWHYQKFFFFFTKYLSNGFGWDLIPFFFFFPFANFIVGGGGIWILDFFVGNTRKCQLSYKARDLVRWLKQRDVFWP